MREMNEHIENITYKPNRYICAECGVKIDLEEEVWVDPATGEATMSGEPYHVECAPNEY